MSIGDDDLPAARARLDDDPRDRMPRWVPRALLLAFLSYLALDVGRWVFLRLQSLLVMLLVSLFLALALEPAVNALERRGWRRGTATGVLMVALLAAGSLFVFAMGSLVFNQVSRIIDDAPELIERAERFLNDRFGADLDSEELIDELTREDGPARQLAERLAGNVVEVTTTALGLLFQLFSIALFSFYLVADGPRLRRAICSTLPPRQQREVLRAWEVAIDKTGGYLYSRALLGSLSATATWVALAVIGVPYALALALWVGLVSQFVPVVGTYMAGALPVLIALANEPVDALWVLAFVLGYQQVENYLFAPRVTARTMSLHPAVAFGSAIGGAALLGAVGALLALPAAASIQAFVGTYIRHHDVVETALTQRPVAHRHRNRPWLRWRVQGSAGPGPGPNRPGAGDGPVPPGDA